MRVPSNFPFHVFSYAVQSILDLVFANEISWSSLRAIEVGMKKGLTQIKIIL
jgi:hypothetical protein